MYDTIPKGWYRIISSEKCRRRLDIILSRFSITPYSSILMGKHNTEIT
ncbi:predicted protein [Botrytis cinerea T4]|uniref:Uncharacterized protein n=1 Tax=Botryotinia fuckeliana (strain T4) TaxID=999810 RepID=G2YHF5_BOTF4|nr:predicted protein [Botrytis cinerea T4]